MRGRIGSCSRAMGKALFARVCGDGRAATPHAHAARGHGTRRWSINVRPLIVLLLVAAVILTPSAARQDALAQPQERWVEITPEARRGIDRGLAWLAAAQEADGSYSGRNYGKHVGITALACLAFMADGNLPGRGRYGENVARGLEFVLAHVQETGLIAANTSHGPMYGHGFATLFLGEVYGHPPDPRVREALVKAVRLIVASQNDEGGWRYQPVPVEADISVTICEIMALRSARNAGISVPKETIDRAIKYVKDCFNPADGGFLYRINQGTSAFPRSAAGVASLYYAGVYEDDMIDRGLKYLMRYIDDQGRRRIGHYFYGHYYAAQAMHLAGDEYWRKWYPMIRDELLDQQQADGSWTYNHGEQYATAMALIVLQMPNDVLPIFEK